MPRNETAESDKKDAIIEVSGLASIILSDLVFLPEDKTNPRNYILIAAHHTIFSPG